MKRYILVAILFVFAFCTRAVAQLYTLSGKIVDPKNSAISFVSVYIKNSSYGTTSNENGVYQFRLSPGTYNIIYRFVGYQEKTEKVTIGNGDQQLDIKLENEVFAIKKTANIDTAGPDTAALSIMRKVIAKRKDHLDEVM